MLTTTSNRKRVLASMSGRNNQVEIPEGEFYTLKGHILKITPQQWSVEKPPESQGETDMKGESRGRWLVTKSEQCFFSKANSTGFVQ